MDLFGLSFGKSSSEQSSSSESQASSRTSQEVFLQDLYSSMFSGAAGAAGGIDTAGITSAANELFGTGSGFIDSLSGGREGFVPGAVGVDGVTPIGAAGSTAEAEIAMLQSDLGRLFSEELQPAIGSTAIAGGGYGGGRQQVAEGQAAGLVANEFVRGATDIRGRDIDRQLQVDTLNQQAELASLGLGLEADKFNQTVGSAHSLESRGLDINAASQALSFLPQQLGLAQAGAGAELDPYMMLAQILGDPTVLTDAESQSSSGSRSSGKSKSFNFGARGA